MSLTMNELKSGTIILLDGTPHEILETTHSHFGRGGSTLEARLKNLKTGAVFSRNFKQADTFEEADIEKNKIKFLYQHRGKFWFCEPDNPAKRFSLSAETIGRASRFLKQNCIVETIGFRGEIFSIKLPVKMDFRVIEAPPSIKGNTIEAGSKPVKLETGAEIQAPLFIEEGDIIKVNTELGEYVERVEKAR